MPRLFIYEWIPPKNNTLKLKTMPNGNKMNHFREEELSWIRENPHRIINAPYFFLVLNFNLFFLYTTERCVHVFVSIRLSVCLSIRV